MTTKKKKPALGNALDLADRKAVSAAMPAPESPTERRKPGRPSKAEEDKVKPLSVYFTREQRAALEAERERRNARAVAAGNLDAIYRDSEVGRLVAHIALEALGAAK